MKHVLTKRRRRRTGVIAAGTAAAVVLALGLASPAAGAATSWPQFGNGPAHSGVNASETAISAATVGNLTLRYSASLPGTSDGPPVYQPGVVTPSGTRDLLFVTTKSGWIVALDASTGSTIWSHQNGPGGCTINNDGSTPCYTTSSPAIDPAATFVYSYGLDGRVHKYRIGDGSEVKTAPWPELTTTKPFDEKSSPALTIATVNGTSYLYAANGGYPGDRGDYQGHVTTINLATGAQKVFNTLCSDKTIHFTTTASTDCPQVQSAVWARPSVDYDAATNRIYFATGNGTFDGVHNWGDSVLALNPDGSGAGGGPVDSYTPLNQDQLNSSDRDLGSTAPEIVTAPAGSTVVNLGVQGGKDAKLRLLNLSNLSGQGGPGHQGGELSPINVPQGGTVLTQPAAWVDPATKTSWVFVANGNGISALKVVLGTGSKPQLAQGWTSTSAGTSPIIAGGVLFYLTNGGARALNPTTGQVLWSDPSGTVGLHWQSPIVVNGALFYADGSGHLRAFTLPTASRVAGADRYATSAALSASTFSPGVQVAYIASGTGFADALSGSAAAGKGGGPVLLVTPTGIPSSVAAELTRLRPTSIVVLGGTGAVSDGVRAQLAKYASGGATSVSRIAGTDRYDTSARISKSAFAPSNPVAYVASGEDFPDALSGGALAAGSKNGGPVLLVTHDAIPASITTELGRLKPANIVVLGGTGAVSTTVEQQLAGFATRGAAGVTRIEGTDRYGTSAAVANTFTPGASVAYVAVGTSFADGLAAASAAGHVNAPVLLVTTHSIPAAIADALTKLQPTAIIVVGGTGAVDNSVQQALGAYVH
ncbi:PQQ-binding-like beta-propeller repeat protein [Diaminobutyricibacter tongyongensis]|uniref:PQQ-binding-like beta-propeller repeat protein n=1 Tax=Leifsonia tongyongensis TaxID=1268043 RepID=A0A6L9Y156_9MICO|nr:cell wall-binding repeat-containing protein [Diaminobutyricibacter tongyongensis]NEN07429.1 PQQ-binding-like beta-propeller repeat protein [Diaminobutyricibacter tongyongensis]